MISPSQFSLFKSTVNTMVGQAYSSTPTRYKRFCTTDSMGSGSQRVYGWTGMLPKPRLWSGPRVVVEAAPQTYTVIPLPYEETVKIDRFELDDDQYGIYYRLLPDLARQLKRQPDLWWRDLIEARGDLSGTIIQTGMDGLAHWHTAHPVDLYDSGKGTYCNDFTSGGQTIDSILVGGAFSVASVSTLREYRRTLKAEDGEPMGVLDDVIIVPTSLELEAELILKSMFFASPTWGTVTGQVGAADNPMRRFGLEVVVHELLVSKTKWYIADTTKAVKPFLWVEREPVRMVPRTSETDPVVFDEHAFLWGGWGRGTPAWAFPWLSARSGP